MRRLADAIEQEEQGEQSAAQASATDERIAKLETQLTAAKKRGGPSAVEDALEEISDEEMELIRAHRAGIATPPPAAAEPPAADPPAVRTRAGRKKGKAAQFTVDEAGKVQKTDVAPIFSGEDEEDEVPIEENAA